MQFHYYILSAFQIGDDAFDTISSGRTLNRRGYISLRVMLRYVLIL